MKPRVYIESSVVSYLTARPSRHILTLARQDLTLSWWALHHQEFTGFASQLVVQEISRGDVDAALKRVNLCQQLSMLEISQEAEDLAGKLLEQGAIPKTEPEDALHVAIAVVNRMDYIATWNFVHMVGASAKFKLQLHISRLGYVPPILVTPQELLEEIA